MIFFNYKVMNSLNDSSNFDKRKHMSRNLSYEPIFSVPILPQHKTFFFCMSFVWLGPMYKSDIDCLVPRWEMALSMYQS